ncbi:MAG: TOBE domain-containing protein [Planctomycetes bacterium]|nr:TOBE domain-containing protein [Planctomycetota bacterium]
MNGIAGQGVSTALGMLTLADVPRWDQGTLAIRPERIRVCAQPPSSNAVRARIDEVVFRGDAIDCVCDRGLRVRLPAGSPTAVGDVVWLELPAEHLRMLDD